MNARYLSMIIMTTLAASCLIAADRVEAGTYVGTQAELWPNGVVPYEWAPDFIAANQQYVLDAMAVWEGVANVQFVPRNGEDDYVLIQNAGEGEGSNARVGRGEGGARTFNIRESWSGWSPSAILYGLAHEVGHVLGFHHSHQRPDRDLYIDVKYERINDCKFGNFDIDAGSLGWPRDRMDFDSIMSYGQCIFSTCNYDLDDECECNDEECPRWAGRSCAEEFCCSDDPSICAGLDILPPNESWQTSMGQRSHLSDIDIQLMSFLYPPADWKFVENDAPSLPGSGSFHRPYKTLPFASFLAPEDTILWIVPDTYQGSASVYDKPMLWKATHGVVVAE